MKKISVLRLAIRNILHRKVRSVFLGAFVFILTASLLVSSLLTSSMELTINNTIDRMGADIIVTSEENASDYSESVFNGELNSFYISRESMELVQGLDGVEKISPQMFVATLDSDCCAAPVQVIGFEPETDFIVQPWLDEMGIDKLEKGQVIIGSAVNSEKGLDMKIFDQYYKVAGKLATTGTGYDTSVFMDFDTIYTLFESDKLKESTKIDDPTKYISAIMMRTTKGTNNKALARVVNYRMPDSGLKAFATTDMFETVSGTLRQMNSYSRLLIGLLFVMAVLALVCIFNITVNERQREFGIMLSVGAKKGQVFGMLLLEAAIIGVVAGALGVIVGGGGVYLFSDVILKKLDMPYLMNGMTALVELALPCFLVAVATSLISVLYAAIKISRMAPFEMIQEVGE